MGGQQTRRTHKKSKTGCITCKARRIKCSEEKPSCMRCLKAGRFCEGYVTDDRPNRMPLEDGEYFSTPLLSPMASLSPYFGGPMSPLELRSLQYFHERTVPDLAGLFESKLWQRLLPQISVTEPGLRHAMIAVAFLQKLSELYGLPALDFEEKPATSMARFDRHDAFGLEQYMKAVTLIRRRLSSGDQDNIVTLVACILFVCLEFLRGERKAAFAHLKSGLDIIKLRMEHEQRVGSSSLSRPLRQGTLNETDLAPMFARMSLLSTLHRQPKSDPFTGMLDLESTTCGEAGTFESLEQARIVAINAMNATIRFCWLVITRQLPGEATISAGRREMEARLEAWSQGFEPFLPVAMFRDPSTLTRDLRGPAVLRVHHIMAVIWAKVVKCPQDEWSYDFMLDHFTYIVNACEAVIDLTNKTQAKDAPRSTFSLDHGIIAPLFFAAVKCRDPSTRRKAITLLYRAPRREGVWDAITAAKLAEVHVSVEEEPLLEPSNEDWPPLHSRIIDFDMRMRNSKTPNKQLVMLRKVRPDGQEEPECVEQYLYYEDSGINNTPYSDRSLKPVAYKDPISTFESPLLPPQHDMGNT